MRKIFLLAALLALNATAAEYPERPIRIVVPFEAGSGTDVVARAIGAALATRMKAKVNVENMAGADGATGTVAVAKAKPDGYTLLATSNALTIAPYLVEKPSYDPAKNFVAVARIATIPMVLVTSSKSRFSTFKDLSVGKALYATAGRGTPSHLEVELMNSHLKLQGQARHFRSGEEALAATASGQAGYFLANLPMALAQLNSGSLRALAVTSTARQPRMPNVPTLAEATRRTGYEALVWFGLLAPAGTSHVILTRLEDEISYELEGPAVAARIETVGGQVAFLRSAPFGAQVRFEYAKWGQIRASLASSSP